MFKEGKSFSLFPFRVLYLETPALNLVQPIAQQTEAGASVYLQTAFSVSKKYFKKATERNRVKRLMREAWRLQKNALEHQLNKDLNVFIIYVGNELPEYNLVVEKTAAVIKRLLKICNEATVSNT